MKQTIQIVLLEQLLQYSGNKPNEYKNTIGTFSTSQCVVLTADNGELESPLLESLTIGKSKFLGATSSDLRNANGSKVSSSDTELQALRGPLAMSMLSIDGLIEFFQGLPGWDR